MKNFRIRAITGLSFAFIMTAGILFSPWTFLFLFLLITGLGLVEFYRLLQTNDISPQVIPGVLVSIAMILLMAITQWLHSYQELMVVIFPLTAILFIAELYRKKASPFKNIALTIAGIIYLTLPVLLMIRIAFGLTPGDGDDYHGEVIMGCILILWASDTGAYMIGSMIGKHRLFERISPKKSWEGFFGGMLLSVVASWVVSKWFPDLRFEEWCIIAIIIVITGTFGDLVESMLKRSTGVKDSGNLLPGHGGILDRFDGLLLSIPFVFFYLTIAGKF